AAGILNHPAIVTVHDIGQDEENGTSFIAMEYVEGYNLKEVLSQGRTLNFEQIGDVIAQVAEALDFAHSKGIVHRDVKPANIILIDGNRAKITDFGIAKIASGGANLTSTGQFLGTPNYMAPEQIKGAPVDGRTDIFALGICLYECLTRRKPFGGDSLTSISYKIVHEPFPPLREVNPQIPSGFEEVVANCLAKDVTKRYQRAKDVAAALRAVMRGERPVRPAEPMLADETIVTRDRAAEKTTERDNVPVAAPFPTVEVPFPDAVTPPPPVAPLTDLSGSTRAVPVKPAVVSPSAPTVAKTPRPPMGNQLRTTLTNVRTLPLWRRRIPPAIFIGIIGILVAALIGGVAAVRAQQTDIPPVDRAAEARAAKQKSLRVEGQILLQQRRYPEAYATFQELQRLAPRSPYVNTMLERINAIRQQEEVGKQQLTQAQAKFDEALALFQQKQFAAAGARFREAQALNPGHPQAAEYVKLAAQEEQKALASSRKSKTKAPATTTTVATETTAGAPVQTAQSTPAQLTTVFSHPFTDGRIVVRLGGDIVANERLFDERPARFLRRASRTARPIHVTHDFPSKHADVQVWVTVPSAQIQEYRSLGAKRFEPGAQHRLTVRYDAASKNFTYELE
ncbi:MAG TPA: protein kinase, partial [Thermoanaerobaculia bacterium]